MPYLCKKLSKSQLSDPLFGLLLMISEVGSPDYIAKSAIFNIWVFWVISMHYITLFVIIDIHNVRTFFTTLSPLWNSEVFSLQLASISWNLVVLPLILGGSKYDLTIHLLPSVLIKHSSITLSRIIKDNNWRRFLFQPRRTRLLLVRPLIGGGLHPGDSHLTTLLKTLLIGNIMWANIKWNKI